MITITPTTGSVLNNPGGNRMQMNQNQRFPHPGRQNFFLPFRAYRQGGSGPVVFDPEFDGKRLRKSAMRKTVDYNAAIIKKIESRVWQRDYRDQRALLPDAMYIPDLMPPSQYQDNPINSVTTRFVKTATNKMRCPIFCMAWTPEGRRLVTGASSGEFTLWNGLTFNFETILQAHDSPVRTMVWSHNEMWMVTADHAGFVKYWQSNMNNVKMFMAHQEAIRGISFSPLDSKFASCSDDGTIKIWDFYRCQEERALRGHGADVKCVHWHPHKGLLISGSKDNQQPVKLWDPKSGTSLATIHAHKSTVMDVKWNNNGNWFVTASRDHLLKLFDIRNLNVEVQVFRGHKKESSSVAWHPIHEGLFCSGGSDGAILFWHVGADKEVGAIEQAHDSIVWTLAWHPMGHILCSGSNDHTSKFWTRNRPGDSMRDKYNLNTLPPNLGGVEDIETEDVVAVIPGMGPEDKVDVKEDFSSLPGLSTGTIPGLDDVDLLIVEDKNKGQSKKVPYSKPIPKNFQAQWNDAGKIDDLDDDDKDGVDPIALLNHLIEQQPGAILLKDLPEPEALHIYGKTLTIRPGSNLHKAISEGTDKMLKYLHSGAVKIMRDVLPYYDNGATVETDEEEDVEHPLKEHNFGPLQELIDKQKEDLANAKFLQEQMDHDGFDDPDFRHDSMYYDDCPDEDSWNNTWDDDGPPSRKGYRNDRYRDRDRDRDGPYRDRDRNRRGRGRDRNRDRFNDRNDRWGGRSREGPFKDGAHDDDRGFQESPFNDGPLRNDNFDGPVNRNGPVGRGGPMNRDGPMGPGGPMNRDGPMGPGGPMNRDGPMGPGGPMNRDGPMGPGGPMNRDGPMGPGGPMNRDGPMRPGGPLNRDGPMAHGGPMNRDGPMNKDGPMGMEGPMIKDGPGGPDGPLLPTPNFSDGPPGGQGGFPPLRGGFHGGNRGGHHGSTGGGFGGPPMMNMYQNQMGPSQGQGPFGQNCPPMHMGPNSNKDHGRFNDNDDWNDEDAGDRQDNGYNHYQEQGPPRGGGFRGGNRGFRGGRRGWRSRQPRGNY